MDILGDDYVRSCGVCKGSAHLIWKVVNVVSSSSKRVLLTYQALMVVLLVTVSGNSTSIDGGSAN